MQAHSICNNKDKLQDNIYIRTKVRFFTDEMAYSKLQITFLNMMFDDTLSSEYSLAEYIHHFKLKLEH